MYMKLSLWKPKGHKPKKGSKFTENVIKAEELHCFTDVHDITLPMQFQKQLHSLGSFGGKKNSCIALCRKAGCEIIRNVCGFKMDTFESLCHKQKKNIKNCRHWSLNNLPSQHLFSFYALQAEQWRNNPQYQHSYNIPEITLVLKSFI